MSKPLLIQILSHSHSLTWSDIGFAGYPRLPIPSRMLTKRKFSSWSSNPGPGKLLWLLPFAKAPEGARVRHCFSHTNRQKDKQTVKCKGWYMKLCRVRVSLWQNYAISLSAREDPLLKGFRNVGKDKGIYLSLTSKCWRLESVCRNFNLGNTDCRLTIIRDFIY